jgi:hypothetical protein
MNIKSNTVKEQINELCKRGKEFSSAFDTLTNGTDRNFSVVNQGVSYLNLMLNNKADFILEYNEELNNSNLQKAFN